jgi:hypothetical protein
LINCSSDKASTAAAVIGSHSSSAHNARHQ